MRSCLYTYSNKLVLLVVSGLAVSGAAGVDHRRSATPGPPRRLSSQTAASFNPLSTIVPPRAPPPFTKSSFAAKAGHSRSQASLRAWDSKDSKSASRLRGGFGEDEFRAGSQCSATLPFGSSLLQLDLCLAPSPSFGLWAFQRLPKLQVPDVPHDTRCQGGEESRVRRGRFVGYRGRIVRGAGKISTKSAAKGLQKVPKPAGAKQAQRPLISGEHRPRQCPADWGF